MDGFDFLWLALRVLSEEAFGPPTVADDFTEQLRQLPSRSVVGELLAAAESPVYMHGPQPLGVACSTHLGSLFYFATEPRDESQLRAEPESRRVSYDNRGELRIVQWHGFVSARVDWTTDLFFAKRLRAEFDRRLGNVYTGNLVKALTEQGKTWLRHLRFQPQVRVECALNRIDDSRCRLHQTNLEQCQYTGEPTIQLAASQVTGGVSTMTVSEIYNACGA